MADEHGGKLPNRAVFYADEFGTLPKIESAEMMFSASGPGGLHRPHHPEPEPAGEELWQRGGGNHSGQCAAHHLSALRPQQRDCPGDEQSLGSRTVQTGYISKGKDNGSQSLQMMERPS